MFNFHIHILANRIQYVKLYDEEIETIIIENDYNDDLIYLSCT